MVSLIGAFEDRDKENGLNTVVYNLKRKYMTVWWDISADSPKFSKKYGYWTKLSKKRECNNFIARTMNHIRLLNDCQDRERWSKGLKDLILGFAQGSMEIDKEYLDIPLDSQNYIRATKSFIREVEDFNPAMSLEDMFQALRNVWIMNSIQVIIDKEIENSPSIFAYSMLYPYSDNYLDNPYIPQKKKVEFNNRFKSRLQGYDIDPMDNHEEDIFRLVSMIEGQYPRERFPMVYQSLLAIHNAQEKSVLQQRGNITPYQGDILSITFEKGGTSVLADGYLVKGVLDSEEADFMFGYGILLQLADDLRDASTDASNGHMTIFSQQAKKWPLDNITNKLFNFIEYFFNNSRILHQPHIEKFREVIRGNCLYLILDGIANNRNLFSSAYIKLIDSYCIYPLPYLIKVNKRIKKEYTKLEKSGIDLGMMLGLDE